jgi:hypothetical protein
MSQFVDVENQNLLWRMAHKIPEFDRMNAVQRGSLFKQTVQQTYNCIEKQDLSREELQTYNRTVLSQLVKQLRSPVPPSTKPPLAPQRPPRTQPQPFVESKEELFQRQFQAKQQEYESMNAKPNLPDASEMFKEKVDDDERIHNMDDLIKQYETQRNEDMQEVMSHMNPPPSTSGHPPSDTLEPKTPQIEQFTELLEKLNKLEQRVSFLEKSNTSSVLHTDLVETTTVLRKSI